MAERLGVDRSLIKVWAEIGVLHPVKYSNGTYFKSTADKEFFDEWNGYDLSTIESAKASKELKRREARVLLSTQN